MSNLSTSRKKVWGFRGFVLMLTLILVACGNDSGDSEPTATSGASQNAAPTVPSAASSPESEVNEDAISVITPGPPSSATSEATSVASPTSSVIYLTGDDDAEEAGTPEAVVETVPTNVSTPAVDATPAGEPVATERPRTGNETYTNPGDGTGGSGMPGEQDSGSGAPVVATPVASPIAVLSVEGCDVPDVPNYVGDTTTFQLMSDLNFRSGPGVDCEPVIDTPLGEGQVVEVTGGPVIQASDESEWVQVTIDGTTGWISTEFIEPAE